MVIDVERFICLASCSESTSFLGLKMRSQISQYPKVVSSVYDAQKPAQVISVSNVQRLAALGCSSEVKIVRIESPSGITDMCTYTDAPINSTITDISWATLDIGKLAISYSNGSITCLNVAEKASRQSQILSEVWNSGKVSTGVNRISWHSMESNTIASANQDGIVRIFDFRSPGTAAKISTYGQRGFVATRDIEFDPFHTDIFAEVSENGSLKMWDRRHTSKPLVTKTKAHGGQVLSVSWSPCWEWVLATGSKDKTVKIWDFSSCPIQFDKGDSGKSNTGSAGAWEPELVNMIYTPSEVSRLRWSITNTGNGSSSSNSSIAPLLATISTGAGTSSESAGHIAVWDLLNQNIPLCVLKGHGQDMCADFSWLNHNNITPSPSTSSGSGLNTPSNDRNSNSIASLVNPRRAGRGNSAKPEARRKGSTSESVLSLAVPGLSDKSSSGDAPSKQLNPVTSLVLGILSAGRDGKILIQDLRYGYFPNHHISPSVMAISSQGHAAFHRGYVHKKFSTSIRSPYFFADFASYLSALASFRKRLAPELPAPLTASLKHSDSSDSLNGTSGSFSTSKAAQQSKSPVNLAKARNATAAGGAGGANGSSALEVVPLDRRSGVVFFGSQYIASLEDAKRIRSERGAEARVTDPALIAIFAKRYRVPYTIPEDPADLLSIEPIREFANAEEEEHYLWEKASERQHRQAIRACQANLEAAVAAGLHCRVAVWTTLLSLLPPPIRVLPVRLEEEVSLPEGALPSHLLMSPQKDRRNEFNESPLDIDSPMPPMTARSRQLSRQQCKEEVRRKPRNDFPELPFTLELIGTLLGELLEGGDVQHFVVACEILRKGGILPAVCKAVGITDVQVQRGYLVYIDLLTKLGLFCEATDIIKASEDKYISSLNQQGVQVGMKCSACNKELTTNTATGWCERCLRSVSVCVLCNKPATGLIHWCPVCAHGGHLACTKRWFAQSEDCPAGCGHNCCSNRVLKVENSPSSVPGNIHAVRETHKRMEWLQNLEFCLSAAGSVVRSRSNSRATNRIISSMHASHSNGSPTHSNFYSNGFGVEAPNMSSSRAVERQVLRKKRFQALQMARR